MDSPGAVFQPKIKTETICTLKKYAVSVPNKVSHTLGKMLIKLYTYTMLYFGITTDLVSRVNFPDANESQKKLCENKYFCSVKMPSEETNNIRALSKPKF